MQSIRVPLFSAHPNTQCVILVPILDQADLTRRVENLAKRHQSVTRYINEKNHVNCRELFQERNKPDLFFFPSARGKCLSLQMLGFGEIFFLRHASYGFIFCFSPNIKATFITQTMVKSFSEVQNYPPKVIEAASFFLSSSHISILVSEHGRMTANSDGELVVQGIEIAFLQKKRYHGKSVFVQRKNECVSPDRPLRAGVEPLQRYNKYIKVRCICNEPGFCYFAQFPILSEKELEQEIIQDQEKRFQRYGAESQFYTLGPSGRYILQPLTTNKHLVMFPHGMGIDVPFGDVQGGKLFFSYADKTLSGCSWKKIKLIFFPPLFNPGENLQVYPSNSVKEVLQKERNTKISFCGSTQATIFTSTRIKLVSCSSSEYKLDGAKVEMISTKNYGGWCVCFFCETINLASSPVPGPSGVGNRGTITQAVATVSVQPVGKGKQTQKRKRSPVPGPSGLGNRGTITQAAATVSVQPGRKGKQTQKRKRSPVPGSSDVSFPLYSYGPYPYGQLPFCEGRSPMIPYSQPTATVVIPSEQQRQQTQQRRSPVPGSSDVSFPLYSYGPYPYGQLPFCEGRSPMIPYSQPTATVVIPSEQQRQQTQQRRSPVPGSSDVSFPLYSYGPYPYGQLPFCEGRSPMIPYSQPTATVVIPSEQQRRSPAPVPYGGSFPLYSYGPYPYGQLPFCEGRSPMIPYSQPTATVVIPSEQQRRSPAPVPYGGSFHPYLQHGTGDFYPYEGSYQPLPCPSATPVAAFDPLRYEIPVQEEDVGSSGKEEASAEVSVGSVQQKFIWSPYEKDSSVEVPTQAQADNPDEDKTNTNIES